MKLKMVIGYISVIFVTIIGFLIGISQYTNDMIISFNMWCAVVVFVVMLCHCVLTPTFLKMIGEA